MRRRGNTKAKPKMILKELQERARRLAGKARSRCKGREGGMANSSQQSTGTASACVKCHVLEKQRTGSHPSSRPGNHPTQPHDSVILFPGSGNPMKTQYKKCPSAALSSYPTSSRHPCPP